MTDQPRRNWAACVRPASAVKVTCLLPSNIYSRVVLPAAFLSSLPSTRCHRRSGSSLRRRRLLVRTARGAAVAGDPCEASPLGRGAVGWAPDGGRAGGHVLRRVASERTWRTERTWRIGRTKHARRGGPAALYARTSVRGASGVPSPSAAASLARKSVASMRLPRIDTHARNSMARPVMAAPGWRRGKGKHAGGQAAGLRGAGPAGGAARRGGRTDGQTTRGRADGPGRGPWRPCCSPRA